MVKHILIVLVIFSGIIACQGNKTSQETDEAKSQIVEFTYKVEGMTCDHCEMSIHKGVKELEGVEIVQANHEDSSTYVKFDLSKLSEDQIKEAIKKRGYKVLSKVN